MRAGREADWLTVQEAVARILQRVQPLRAEAVPLLDALGLVLAAPAISPIDQPPWDNSGMDGFAAKSEDVRGASRGSPVVLRVVDSIPAGGFPTHMLRSGEAAEIMTGAPLPEGADCVVRVEHTLRESPDTVSIIDDVDTGRNVRPRGEDLRARATILEAGRVLRAAEIGVLATMGEAEVRAHRRPRVAILSTGDELVDLDQFAEVRAGRKIVNSNSYAIAAAVRATGCVPELLGIARDDRVSLREHLVRGLGADVLVTTAGASVGEHDLVKDVLESLGFELDFWRVQMRPGSPFSFGALPRGSLAPQPVFGLPGNPVSALVTFEVLVRPALRRMLGRQHVHTATVRVRAAERIESKPGLVHYLRVKLERAQGGGQLARLTGPQGSGILTSMAEADALLVIALDETAVEVGEQATAISLLASDESQAFMGY